MPDHLGKDMRKVKPAEEKDEKPIEVLDEGDIAILKNYGAGAYAKAIKKTDDDIKAILKSKPNTSTIHVLIVSSLFDDDRAEVISSRKATTGAFICLLLVLIQSEDLDCIGALSYDLFTHFHYF